MEKLKQFLNYTFSFSENIYINVKTILIVTLVFFITSFLLRMSRKLLTKRLDADDQAKFKTVFSFAKYFIYTVVLLLTVQNMGINITAVFAASAALMVGVGLALQTVFQDIFSGIIILVDKTVHVDDIIEIDNKVGRVTNINLRTTRAVTIDNKVLIIPNHKYLTNSLYNWTQNGTITREHIEVGVAYGSDLALVKRLLIRAAEEHPKILKIPEPLVLFMGFGDSSLNFRLIFTLDDSFAAGIPKSDLRFRVDELFREHKVSIPFPQRDVHIFEQKIKDNV
ncbi:mechanosensitive ion channel family protein [Sungkyunkwania multivorans]|uniref:Mechanosensitive ion channel family protein n=1 Tax=Sungkyunkwania multivorans TaxID=1173618 RepID=A0ABW3D3D9_9FLAO